MWNYPVILYTWSASTTYIKTNSETDTPSNKFNIFLSLLLNIWLLHPHLARSSKWCSFWKCVIIPEKSVRKSFIYVKLASLATASSIAFFSCPHFSLLVKIFIVVSDSHSFSMKPLARYYLLANTVYTVYSQVFQTLTGSQSGKEKFFDGPFPDP